MSWTDVVFELIDLRSFSSLWYWIALGAIWTRAGSVLIGVPLDLVHRARREGGGAGDDLEAILSVWTRRRLRAVRTGGTWLVGIVTAALVTLAILGFGYGVEFAQAILLIALPMTFVWLLGLREARILAASDLGIEAVCRRLLRHRAVVQLTGAVSIFVTALWGMYVNLAVGPFG